MSVKAPFSQALERLADLRRMGMIYLVPQTKLSDDPCLFTVYMIGVSSGRSYQISRPVSVVTGLELTEDLAIIVHGTGFNKAQHVADLLSTAFGRRDGFIRAEVLS